MTAENKDIGRNMVANFRIQTFVNERQLGNLVSPDTLMPLSKGKLK